jgi:hypothetical protein
MCVQQKKRERETSITNTRGEKKEEEERGTK